MQAEYSCSNWLSTHIIQYHPSCNCNWNALRRVPPSLPLLPLLLPSLQLQMFCIADSNKRTALTVAASDLTQVPRSLWDTVKLYTVWKTMWLVTTYDNWDYSSGNLGMFSCLFLERKIFSHLVKRRKSCGMLMGPQVNFSMVVSSF